MRILVLLVAGLGVSASAASAADIKTKLSYYSISGDSGARLLMAMDRKGPKHGFLTRAIAQTRYSLSSGADLAYSNGACRATKARIGLDMTYVYPKVATPVSPSLRNRWNRFFAGVRKHEETHGRLAREMTLKAERAVGAIAVPGDRSCAKARLEVKRRVNRIVAEYERRQVRFDEVEHSDGGKVDHLVLGLLGERG